VKIISLYLKIKLIKEYIINNVQKNIDILEHLYLYFALEQTFIILIF